MRGEGSAEAFADRAQLAACRREQRLARRGPRGERLARAAACGSHRGRRASSRPWQVRPAAAGQPAALMTSPGETLASPVSTSCTVPSPPAPPAGARLRRRPFPHVFSVFPVVYVAFQVHTEPGARLSFHQGLLRPQGGHHAGCEAAFPRGRAWAGSPEAGGRRAGVCNRSPGLRHSWWRPWGWRRPCAQLRSDRARSCEERVPLPGTGFPNPRPPQRTNVSSRRGCRAPGTAGGGVGGSGPSRAVLRLTQSRRGSAVS